MHVRVDWNINTKPRLVRHTSMAKVNSIKQISGNNNESHVPWRQIKCQIANILFG